MFMRIEIEASDSIAERKRCFRNGTSWWFNAPVMNCMFLSEVPIILSGLLLVFLACVCSLSCCVCVCFFLVVASHLCLKISSCYCLCCSCCLCLRCSCCCWWLLLSLLLLLLLLLYLLSGFALWFDHNIFSIYKKIFMTGPHKDFFLLFIII